VLAPVCKWQCPPERCSKAVNLTAPVELYIRVACCRHCRRKAQQRIPGVATVTAGLSGCSNAHRPGMWRLSAEASVPGAMRAGVGLLCVLKDTVTRQCMALPSHAEPKVQWTNTAKEVVHPSHPTSQATRNSMISDTLPLCHANRAVTHVSMCCA
jgi:hypothetical protein